MSDRAAASLALAPRTASPPAPDGRWLQAARQARWLSYLSLAWMLAEGGVGILAGIRADSVGVLAWAFGSAVEAAAAVIVIVRLTGRNRFSEDAERRAQRWVAASLLVLVPYIMYGSASELSSGRPPHRTLLAIGLLGSSVVLMPGLGWAKRRLGRRLSSGATSGEGTQNLLCALQGAIGLTGLLAASAGAAVLDPVAALLIAAIAIREGMSLWRGEECCQAIPGFDGSGDGCAGGEPGGC